MSDGLHEIAAAEGIRVLFKRLPYPLLGLYSSCPGEQPLILLHENIRHNRKQLRCIFAEEIGHHYTCAVNTTSFAASNRLVYDKYDRLAVWWAINHLIPFRCLLAAISAGHTTIYDLAEHFDVTEEFMVNVIYFYKLKKRACCNNLN